MISFSDYLESLDSRTDVAILTNLSIEEIDKIARGVNAKMFHHLFWSDVLYSGVWKNEYKDNLIISAPIFDLVDIIELETSLLGRGYHKKDYYFYFDRMYINENGNWILETVNKGITKKFTVFDLITFLKSKPMSKLGNIWIATHERQAGANVLDEEFELKIKNSNSDSFFDVDYIEGEI